MPRIRGSTTPKLENDGILTQAQIAERLKLSTTRIQQLEARALAKMRAEAIRLGIRWEP